VVNELTPLIPTEVSLKSVTRRIDEKEDDLKLLKEHEIVEGGPKLAERVGFEPTLEFPLNTLSKRAPSATRPSLPRIKASKS
jgi:hypothetical protein